MYGLKSFSIVEYFKTLNGDMLKNKFLTHFQIEIIPVKQ